MIRQHQKAIDLGLFSDSEATRAAQIISALQVVNHLVIKMTEEISMRIDIDNDAVLADMAKSTEKAAKEFSKSRRAKK